MGWLFQKILKGMGICMAAMAVDVMVLKDYRFAAMITALLIVAVGWTYIQVMTPPDKSSSVISKKRAHA